MRIPLIITRLIPIAATAVFVITLAATARAATPLATQRIASGLSNPVFVTAPPGDTTRLFIVERLLGNGTIRTGRIQILDLTTGLLNPTPFFEISGLILGGEVGLLGLAFHPAYPDTPYFYVNIMDGRTKIRRYRVSADPDIADSTSGVNLFNIYQPQANHNGGWLAFGSDDMLYIALGDGGGAGDQGAGHDPLVGNAQSDTTRHGKILRVDVDAAFPYAVPPDNPFFGAPSPKDEFWVKGLRNPWRPSFDRANDDLYIADVGQQFWEELNYQPGTSGGGENYGWRLFEGYALFNCPDPCDSSGLTRPVHVYSHGGAPFRCSITGGYVYRGAAIPDLAGTYFFGDYCSGDIWSCRIVGGAMTELTNRTAELAPIDTSTIGTISSFGEDASGEMYICDLNGGEVFRIIADPTSVSEPGVRHIAALGIEPPAPNPSARGFSTFARLPRAGRMRAQVIDTSGRAVRTLADSEQHAGRHALSWDGMTDAGAPAAGGVYVLRVEAAGEVATSKITLVR